ncbi:hypothetical protein BFJ63_vAg16485 [Fusarium oxysporum f. sp. narcissi]|uniref:Uncharacterized protein n=2 Tax=Fusarium oxysporum TaxID=5507 RepID=A0A4Q2V6L2_FUSOX|nr:hypothetical protein Forpi1262_v015460 [Fusarium oxysporum f. sp. raphani]KAH7461633.1 hypothetical protein FOMA001_g18978 [Fusarium oxysporum f. sp. matthiolae]RYC80629.1 hypothetical protein BFJ63_vAg16485 [Fusarium oxysporum f. sp. narcissi]
MAPTESLQQFEKIEEVVARYALKLSSVRSPAEIYKEKTDEIRGRIAQLWTSLELAPAPEKLSLQDSIVMLGGQLKELEIKYEAGVQDEEKAYNRALQEIADALRYELLEIIGPAKIESYLQSISSENSDRRDSNNAVVTCQPHDATLQAIGAKEACVPKGMPENRHTSSTTTPYKRRRTSPESMGRKRRQVEKDDPRTKLGNSLVSCPAVGSSRRRTRHSHRRHGDKRSSTDEDFEGITNPDAGSIYLAFWEKSKDWFAVLLLPMQDLESVGISGSIESLGLAEVLPRCYCDKQDGFSWAEGFNDGEPLVMEREFPVMYFDGQDFPAKSAVGWVSARDLRQFDANNKNLLVPHIRSVRKFLKTRAEKRSPEREVDRSKSEAPDATEQSSIEANGYPPTPLKVPFQHRSSQMAAPDQGQEEPSSLPATQPVSPLDHIALHDPPIQQQSLPDLRSDEGQQHRLNLEDIATSSHGPVRQLDEPCGIFEPRSTAALSNTTQEVCKDAGLLRPHCNERANRTATPEKNMGARLFGLSVSEQASGVAICPPHPTSRELLPMNLMSNPLKTPEIYATEPFPSSPSIPHASSTDSAQPALLYALEQHAQVEMGRPHSNRPIIDAENSTTEERQQAQQAPSVVQSSNDASDAVGGMPCNADHPRLTQIRTPYNFEASRTTIVLPPISSVLKQGVNSPLSHGPPGQTLTLNNQPSSFPGRLSQLAVNGPSPPSLSPSLCTRPLTTKLASKSPDVRAPFNQISTAQYAPALPAQVQSDDSFHTRGSSASIATEQRRLNSPGAPTSDSHDGCNAQTSRELEVTRAKGDWYKKLPEDLIACLEKYQQDNNLSLGIHGLRIQPGNYVCPFCIESKRKLYKRPSHFSNHLASHWAALKKKH